MATTQIRNEDIKDGVLTLSKFVADFLAGVDWNITDGNNNATITGLAEGVNANDAVNVTQLNAALAALTGVKRLRGGISGAADLTGDATGNAYADGVTQYSEGDVFQIIADGNLTVSDGTIEVKTGDEIVILNTVGDAAITVADVFKIDNTEALDILRTGNIVDDLTSTSALSVLSANQGRVLKELVDALAQFDTAEFTATADGQTFTLPQTPLAGAKNRHVYSRGQRLSTSEFSFAGPVLTITGKNVMTDDCIVVDFRF